MTSYSKTLLNSLFVSLQNHYKDDENVQPPAEVFIAFHSILGSVFSASLDILDRKGITIYKCAKTNREVAVVSGSSGIRYTILLHGHFCPCPSFQYSVLQADIQAGFCGINERPK